MLIFPAMRATDAIRRRSLNHRRKFFSNISGEAMRPRSASMHAE
jgi:hypothetical protein